MDDYLDYVIRLRDRVANSSNQDGVTKWALGVAILYLFFQTVPTMADILYGKKEFTSYIYIFTHTLGFILGAVPIYFAAQSNAKFTLRNYRYKSIKQDDIFRDFIGELFSVVLFFWVNLAYVLVSFFHPEILAKLFILNGPELYMTYAAAFMGFVYIIGMIVVPVSIAMNDPSKHEFPKPLTHVIKGDNKKLGLKIVMIALVCIMFFGNLYYLIFPSILITYENYKDAIMFSVQLSTALMGLNFFIKSISEREALLTLDDLERDIVLHGISENEIKLRLQEHFGYEINEFILLKLSQFKDLVRSIEALMDEYDDFSASLLKIPPEYAFERDKRVKEYLSKLKLLLTSKDKTLDLFIRFLNHLLSEAKEKEVKELITNYRAEVNELGKDISKQTNRFLTKLESLIDVSRKH